MFIMCHPRRRAVRARCALGGPPIRPAPAVRAPIEAPPYHGGILAIVTPPSPPIEPPLFKVPAFLLVPAPPLHRARHGRRLARHCHARPLGHRVREHLFRDPLHPPGSRIAQPSALLTVTPSRRGRHRRLPPRALTRADSAQTSATPAP
jgi:hypothetical protein